MNRRGTSLPRKLQTWRRSVACPCQGARAFLPQAISAMAPAVWKLVFPLFVPLLIPLVVFAGSGDARLREVVYDPDAVVTVPVQRGVVTLVQVGADEAITEVASGLGGDCSKAEAAWCIAAQAGSQHLFIKPKSLAQAPNNVTVLTDRRVHHLRLVVLQTRDAQQPVYRLQILAPAPRQNAGSLSGPYAATSPTSTTSAVSAAIAALASPEVLAGLAPLPAAGDGVAERLQAKPQLRNTAYAMALGQNAEDIAPSLVFDDGRFTYFRFPGNREIPAVFQVLGDGTESVVNTRMEDDLLVVDRVGRRLVLRAGSAVIGIWNEAFDLDGNPPVSGTTVPGVQRVLKSPAGSGGVAAAAAGAAPSVPPGRTGVPPSAAKEIRRE